MMIRRRIRQALIGCGLLIMILQGAAPSQALDFSNHILVYHEDFEGETTTPTSPEVNLLSAGDTLTVGVDGNNNFTTEMAISGGVVLGSIHAEVPPAVQNFAVPSTSSSSFGMRATFNSFSLGLAPADGEGAVGLVASFGPFVGLVVPAAVVSAGVGITRSSGSATGFVLVRYGEGTSELRQTLVALSAGATAAVLGGTPFTVDLFFDKTTMIATASANIAGVGNFAAPPLDVSDIAVITSSAPLVFTSLFVQEGFGLDIDVNMEDILVFLPPPPDTQLLDAKVTAGGEVVLQNAGGTVRLEQAQVHAYDGATFYVPEPAALWQLYSGVALLALLYARRRLI